MKVKLSTKRSRRSPNSMCSSNSPLERLAKDPEYTYPPHQHYYYEEPEGYGDYPDSDATGENTTRRHHPPDMAEMYRRHRKTLLDNTDYSSRYYQNYYVPQYVYEGYTPPSPRLQFPRNHIQLPVQTLQATPIPPVSGFAPNAYSQSCMQCYYSRPYDGYSSSMYRRSAPQIPTSVNSYHPHTTTKCSTTKRYPITFRATRYIRKPPAFYRRPSALCLPFACQPDPGICRRPRRTELLDLSGTSQGLPSPTESVLDSKKSTRKSRLRVKTENDVNARISNLENIVAQLEEEQHAVENDDGNKTELFDLSKVLKPKMPKVLKDKKKMKNESKNVSEQHQMHESKDLLKEKATELPNEATQDSLEMLLNQLKKCELASSTDCVEKFSKTSYKEPGQKLESSVTEIKSFNYEDISKSLLRSDTEGVNLTISDEMPLAPPVSARESKKSIDKDSVSIKLSPSQSKESHVKTLKHKSTSKPSLDDTCALELHRSKSYIVNLIDRALSKELGTVPGEKCERQTFEHMSPKKAIDLVSRHSKVEKEVCLEISQNRTSSVISTDVSRCESKNSQVCLCQPKEEEPLYIKQLKELRWGHLRHIQQEVRRLEDLERFLDSCGSTSSTTF